MSVDYSLDGAVATIRLDDGKANALSLATLQEIDAAFDRAEADRAVVVFAGRAGVFSAGFDLKVLGAGRAEAAPMLRAGFELAYRMLSFPRPIVIACTGHALAMGVFLLLSGDHRIGVAGAAHKLSAIEVAIGLTVPLAAVEICRLRLTPSHFQRAVNLAEVYTPDTGVDAGFLDAVAPADDLLQVATEKARALTSLDSTAYTTTKLRSRASTLAALRAAMAPSPE